MNNLEPFDQLQSALARLPGVGRRSAERMAFHIAVDEKGLAGTLRAALQAVEDQLVCCSRCGNLTLKPVDPCELCTDPRRDGRLLCVLEDPSAIRSLESAGAFRGRYHCLMGKLSPRQGKDISPARLEGLLARIRAEGVQEVVLALDTDVESDATASYLHQHLSAAGVRVSRLAFGIPAGSGLAYSDPVTLARALHGRQSF
jgi:recombination protein RecR